MMRLNAYTKSAAVTVRVFSFPEASRPKHPLRANFTPPLSLIVYVRPSSETRGISAASNGTNVGGRLR